WARSRGPAPAGAPPDQVGGDNTEEPARDRADHDEPDQRRIGVPEHVVDPHLPRVARDQQDQQDGGDDSDEERRVETAAVSVAAAALPPCLVLVALLLLALPLLALLLLALLLLPRLAHAREPNRAR